MPRLRLPLLTFRGKFTFDELVLLLFPSSVRTRYSEIRLLFELGDSKAVDGGVFRDSFLESIVSTDFSSSSIFCKSYELLVLANLRLSGFFHALITPEMGQV